MFKRRSGRPEPVSQGYPGKSELTVELEGKSIREQDWEAIRELQSRAGDLQDEETVPTAPKRVGKRWDRSVDRALRRCVSSISSIHSMARSAASPLKTHRMSILTGCLSIGLLLAALFLVNGPLSVLDLDPATSPSSTPPAASGPGNSVNGIVSDGLAPVEGVMASPSAEVQVGSSAPRNDTASATSQGFLVQVGTFRNPANAERVAESLRQQDLEVEVSEVAGNLQSVRIGPFLERSTADRAAQTAEDITDLSTLVTRFDIQ